MPSSDGRAAALPDSALGDQGAFGASGLRAALRAVLARPGAPPLADAETNRPRSRTVSNVGMKNQGKWSALREVLVEMFSAMSQVIAPATAIGFVGFAVFVPVDLIVPGKQLQWLIEISRDNWGLLLVVIWLLLLTSIWQSAEVLTQREQLESARRRLRKLQGDDD